MMIIVMIIVIIMITMLIELLVQGPTSLQVTIFHSKYAVIISLILQIKVAIIVNSFIVTLLHLAIPGAEGAVTTVVLVVKVAETVITAVHIGEQRMVPKDDFKDFVEC